MKSVFVSSAAVWDCERDGDAPKLDFVSPLFRRRLSKITKMSVQVVHDALEKTKCGDIKIVFSSFRGEVNREFEINKQIIEEKSVLPASFSLSVFNAPMAQATMALGLKSGYTVVSSAVGRFRDAFFASCAPVLSGAEGSVLFVYADERLREEYESLDTDGVKPLAFAVVVSSDENAGKKIDLGDIAKDITSEDFLRIVGD